MNPVSSNVHSRLKHLATRKQGREKLLADLRAGKYDAIIDTTGLLPTQQPSPGSPAPEPMPQLEVLEGPGGRTLFRRITITPDAIGTAMIPHDPGAEPVALEVLPQLLRDGAQAPIDDISSIAFLDTETTGLMGGTGTVPFLVGIGWWGKAGNGGGAGNGEWGMGNEDSNFKPQTSNLKLQISDLNPLPQTPTPKPHPPQFHLEQYLISDFEHERDMMERLAERLSHFAVLCTYNGKSFDVPLLRTRGIMHRIAPARFRHRQLDLLHFSRRLWRRVLPEVSLKRVERAILGVDRGPDIDGAMIPQVFFDFARTGQTGGMPAVLRHNAQDIATLAALLTHVGAVLRDPLGSGRLHQAGEWSAIARWLESQRRLDDAAAAYTHAVRCGGDVDIFARLAALHKRRRCWPEAMALYDRLRAFPMNVALHAWVEMAKHEEHVRRDAAAALRLVRQCRKQLEIDEEMRLLRGGESPHPFDGALADLEHREARLLRRVAAKDRTTPPRHA